MLRFSTPNFIAALALACLLWPAVCAAQAVPQDAKAFVEGHRCSVVDRWLRIHAAPYGNGRDRFLILSLREDPQSYLQCLLLEHDSKVLCEASSGYYASKRFTLPPERIAALRRLGFATATTKGNYQRMLRLGRKPDFVPLAELMLKALHDGYGLDERSVVDFDAPLAPGGGGELPPGCDEGV